MKFFFFFYKNTLNLQPDSKIIKVMAITSLKRKGKRNKMSSHIRAAKIKLLTTTPVIKKVDIEELKKQQNSGSVIGKVKDAVGNAVETVKHVAEDVVEKAKKVTE